MASLGQAGLLASGVNPLTDTSQSPISATPHPAGLNLLYRQELQLRHYAPHYPPPSHYARRTVKGYEQWLRLFLRFHSFATQYLLERGQDIRTIQE